MPVLPREVIQILTRSRAWGPCFVLLRQQPPIAVEFPVDAGRSALDLLGDVAGCRMVCVGGELEVLLHRQGRYGLV